MQCGEAEAMIPRLVTGELGPLSRWRLQRHLRGCPACTLARQETERLVSRARTPPDPPLPADVEERVRTALDRELRRPRPGESQRGSGPGSGDLPPTDG